MRRSALWLCLFLGCGRSWLPPELTSSAATGGGTAASGGGGGSTATTTNCRVELDPPTGRVHFDFPEQPCTFTLAQAAAGVTFRYDVIVEQTNAEFIETWPMPGTTCATPVPDVGIYLLERVGDTSRGYCACEFGHCPESAIATGAQVGRHSRSLTWKGREWFGPSDFNNPMGPAFPPGEYWMSVQALVGDSRTDGPAERATARLFFTLTAN